jgi:uncharacterized protein
MTPTARELIASLGLLPLPGEGGYYRQTWAAQESVAAEALPARYGQPKNLGTAIYYLLTDEPDSFSAMHRLPTDEIYHFYLGDPVEMLLLLPEGASRRPILGNDVRHGQAVQLVVPRDTWQGSRLRPGGCFALMGTTMTPGFDPEDLILGERAVLQAGWPAEAQRIAELTRSQRP